MGQKNPTKFPPNFPANFPPQNQKKFTDELLQERQENTVAVAMHFAMKNG